MKVLLRRNIVHLGKIGDVVDVKPGYARNYLLPQRLAYEPTAVNVKSVEAEKQKYLEELALQRKELQAKAALVEGKEVTITARANEQGHLYGSVGPAQIAAALAATGVFVESEYIVLEQPIRRLDKYDVTVRFDEEVKATIHVWILPAQEAVLPAEEPGAAKEEPAPVEGASAEPSPEAEPPPAAANARDSQTST